MTRRHFFGRASTGIGIAALASLLAEDATSRGRTARPAALPAQSQARHLPVPARRAVAARSVRLQAGAGDAARHGAAGLGPQGPAAHRHDGVPGEVSRPRRRSSSSRSTARAGTWLSELLPHTGEGRRRHLRSSGRMQTERSITIRRSRSSRPDSRSPGGRASAPGSPMGWAARIKDLPAFVVMVSQGGGNAQALADRQWGSGFLPTEYQGVKFRSGGDPVLYLSNPPGYSTRRAPPFPGRSGEAERDRSCRTIRTRRSRRASRSTRWRTGCRARCRS